MVVISDTSCISNLYQIGHIRLLTLLFKKIILPTKVVEELHAFHNEDFLTEIEQSGISSMPVRNMSLVEEVIKTGIHYGEAEAIALSIELEADILLIDEKEGKKVAQQYGLRTLGILGVILLAKNEKLIPSAKQLFDRLREETKFYFADSLYAYLLKQAGE